MRTLQVITIGTEMTLGLRVDSNAARACRMLGEAGYRCMRVTTVPDDTGVIAQAISEAAEASDLVLVTGGLGPTQDDVTREALAGLLGVELEFHQEAAAVLEDRYGRHVAGKKSVLRQAYAPEGARLVLPRLGSAPGLVLRAGDAQIVALPGVPSEMGEMLSRLAPELKVSDGQTRAIRTIKTCDRGEAEVEEQIGDLIRGAENPAVTILALPGEVHVVLVAEAATRQHADMLVADLEASIVARLDRSVFGYDDDTLESQIGRLLKRSGQSLAIAESCTGGMVAERLTGVPGSSDYFLGAVVAYADRVKSSLLGVDLAVLERDGAVSAPAALEMEQGVRRVMGADVGLSTTGIAGPDGGSSEKPVGLAYVAVGDCARTRCRELGMSGSRATITLRVTQAALCLLRALLLGLEDG